MEGRPPLPLKNESNRSGLANYDQAVFLVFGGVTTFWSFFIFFLLPDAPQTAWFLTEEDRDKAVKRVEENMTGIKSDQWKMHQCIEALLDIKAWLLFIIQIAGQIANGGVQSVSSTFPIAK
jgi:hypothetical protein